MKEKMIENLKEVYGFDSKTAERRAEEIIKHWHKGEIGG